MQCTLAEKLAQTTQAFSLKLENLAMLVELVLV